ncbi:hypothetical protein AB0M95_15140 [Sphaerisporangium sp. NPDC051017]|uniref:hypothetical protein n=1 Tax=Sphaerisporangium sp. NPDC051017 TaxID=3154636 RepID=UPI00341EF7BE
MALEAFASWGVPDERAEMACLLVSEVATNVVLHAASVPRSTRRVRNRLPQPVQPFRVAPVPHHFEDDFVTRPS